MQIGYLCFLSAGKSQTTESLRVSVMLLCCCQTPGRVTGPSVPPLVPARAWASLGDVDVPQRPSDWFFCCRFVCCRENGDSQGSWPVSAQGFPAGEGRTSAQQLSVNAIQWKNQDGWRFILPQPKRNPECCDLDTIFHTSEAEPRASVPTATGFGSSFCSFSLFLDHHLRCILSSDPLRVLS